MFKGDSCHPITPTKSEKQNDGQLNIDENDQIFKITNKLDIDPQFDYSHFTDEQ